MTWRAYTPAMSRTNLRSIGALLLLALLCGCFSPTIRDPKHPETKLKISVHRELGRDYMLEGRPAQAFLQFKRVLEVDDDDYPSQVGIGYAAAALPPDRELTVWKEGHEALEGAIDQNDEDGYPRLAMGMLRYQWSRFETRKALGAEDTARSYRLAKQEAKAAPFDQLAKEMRESARERMLAAREVLTEALKLLDEQAKRELEAARKDEVDTDIEATRNGHALRMLALVNAALGPDHYEEAISYLDQITAVTTSLRDQAEAKYLRLLPTLRDADIQAYKALRASFEGAERQALAFAAFLTYELGRLDPVDRPVHWQRSQRYLNRSLELNPESPNALISSAAMDYDQGDHAAAAAKLEKFIQGSLARGDQDLVQRALYEYRRLGGEGDPLALPGDTERED